MHLVAIIMTVSSHQSNPLKSTILVPVRRLAAAQAQRIRQFFEQARECAPCIVFLDELDAVGAARQQSAAGGNQERRGRSVPQTLPGSFFYLRFRTFRSRVWTNLEWVVGPLRSIQANTRQAFPELETLTS